MKKKYLVLLLVSLLLILTGCFGGKRHHVASPPAPSAPSSLSGSAVSSTEIDLAWKDNSTNEKGFYLYRRTTNSYARVAILEVNATSYNDSGLNPETSYWYKVRAYNDGGESGSSNEVNITTLAGPVQPAIELEAPTDLSATVVSYKQINLSWQDNSTTEDGFKVRCNIGHTQTNTIATVGPDTIRYEHCKLQPMTHHKYYIEAFRGEETAGSPQVSATTLIAPVKVVSYSLKWSEVQNTLFYVLATIQNDATEAVRVELTVCFYYVPYNELVETVKRTINIDPLSTKYFSMDWYAEHGGDCWDCTVEITDVEIQY